MINVLRLLDNAEMASAAYADLQRGATDDDLNRVALIASSGAGMSLTQVTQFARTVNQLKGKATMLFIAHQVPRALALDDTVTLESYSNVAREKDSTQTRRGG